MIAQPGDPIFQKISRDPFARWLGIELQAVRPGYGRVAMTVMSQMLNFHGIRHGGAIFSLADAAFAAAGNSHGQTAFALNMRISYLAATSPGSRLLAEAQELRKGHRSGFYEIKVRTDGGELIGACQAMVHRKREPFVQSWKRRGETLPSPQIADMASVALHSCRTNRCDLNQNLSVIPVPACQKCTAEAVAASAGLALYFVLESA